MATSQKACRKIKAVLCIAMLAGADVHHTQEDVLFNNDFNTAMSDLDFQNQAKHIVTMMAESDFLKQAAHVSEQIEIMSEDPTFQKQTKHIAKTMEGVMSNPNFQQQVKLVAEQIMANPTLQEQAKGFAQQVSMIKANPIFNEQADRLAEQMEKNWQTHPQVAEQTEAMEANLDFQKQAKIVAEQMEAMMADPNVHEQAWRLVERMTAGVADPVELKQQNSLGLTDKLADTLFNRVLQVSQIHSRDLDEATLAKPGRLATNSGTGLNPLLALHTLRRSSLGAISPNVQIAKSGQIALPTSLTPVRSPRSRLSTRAMKQDDQPVEDGSFKLKEWFNPYTRGGVIVWSTIVFFIVPYFAYKFFVGLGLGDQQVQSFMGGVFVLSLFLAWTSTYLFRVGTKQMTYATQLRKYEDDVMKKRLEELDDDQVAALMEEIDQEEKALQSREAAKKNM